MSAALDGTGRLQGAVSFANMTDLRSAGEALIGGAEGPEVAFDLSGLQEASTLTVALLVAWLRAAEGCGKSLAFRGAPPGLREIAAFSGVEDMLPFRPEPNAHGG